MFMRVGGFYPIKYFSGVVSRYGTDRSSFSASQSMILRQIGPRLNGLSRVLRETPEGQRLQDLEARAKANWLLWYTESLTCIGARKEASQLFSRALEFALEDGRQSPFLARAEFLWNNLFFIKRKPDSDAGALLKEVWNRIAQEISSPNVEKAKRLVRFMQDSRPLALYPWVKLNRLEMVLNGWLVPRYDPSAFENPQYLMTRWIEGQLRRGLSISEPLKASVIKDIYLYGGGDLGHNFYLDCLAAGIPIKGVVDRRGGDIKERWYPLQVFSPESFVNQLSSVSLVVLTLYDAKQEERVANYLESKASDAAQLTSWKELLYTLLHI
jgi:hypothetical protein